MDVFKDYLAYGRVIGPDEEGAAVKKAGPEEEAAAVKKAGPEEAAAIGPDEEDAAVKKAGAEEEAAAVKKAGPEAAVFGPDEEDAAVRKAGPEKGATAVKKAGPEEAAVNKVGLDEAAVGKKGRWELAWRSAPLILHDRGLVRAINDLDPDLGDVSGSVSTAAITGVLEQHPGPVKCIRVEISDCPSPDMVKTWMKLIERGGPLQELVLVNHNRPTDEAFQLRLLPGGPGGLRRLALGFFALTPLDADHLSPCLAELRLMGCDLCYQALSAILPEMRALRLLVLGCCHVTRGCGPEGFSIVSCSLKRLEMFLCTASGGIRLDYAPKLEILSAGVLPLSTGGQIGLDLRTPGALRELHELTLLHHDLSFINDTTTRSRPRIPIFPNLTIIGVHLHMSNTHAVTNLLDLLRYMPYLVKLTLTRLDSTAPAEQLQCDRQSFAGTPCIASSLCNLTMACFRGGAAEVAFATNVLAVACRLGSLLLHAHPTLLLVTATEASNTLLICPRASTSCQFLFSDFPQIQ